VSKKNVSRKSHVADREEPRRSAKDTKETVELKRQLSETVADLQRVQADFINFKKRSDEEAERKHSLGIRQTVAVLLPTIDNIKRALTHIPKAFKDDAWAQGVKSTAEQLFESLQRLGVERVKTVGEHFDPEFMEAVQVEDGEGEKEIVSKELQSGYKMKDELIRPAMVKVRREK